MTATIWTWYIMMVCVNVIVIIFPSLQTWSVTLCPRGRCTELATGQARWQPSAPQTCLDINLCCQHWQGANTTTVFDINQVYIMLVPLAFLKLLVSSESGWYQEQFQKKRSEMFLPSRTSILVATGNVATRMKMWHNRTHALWKGHRSKMLVAVNVNCLVFYQTLLGTPLPPLSLVFFTQNMKVWRVSWLFI